MFIEELQYAIPLCFFKKNLLICQKPNHMETKSIYDYLNELSRCEWKDNATANGIKYNGIDITQGVESGHDKAIRAIYRKAKEINEQDYDVITPLAVEALKAEFPIPRSEAVKAEIELGEFVIEMHNLQLCYLSRLIAFIGSLPEDDNPKSESKKWNKPVYTSDEVKSLLNISDNTFRRWVNGGWISYSQMDGSDKKFIQREHLLNFLNNPKIFYPSSK